MVRYLGSFGIIRVIVSYPITGSQSGGFGGKVFVIRHTHTHTYTHIPTYIYIYIYIT